MEANHSPNRSEIDKSSSSLFTPLPPAEASAPGAAALPASSPPAAPSSSESVNSDVYKKARGKKAHSRKENEKNKI